MHIPVYRFLIVILSFSIAACTSPTPEVSHEMSSERLDARLDLLSDKMKNYLPEIEVDSMKIPRSTEKDGTLISTNSRKWTSGFFPGTLWQLYRHSEDPKLREAAATWTSFVEKEKWDTHTHDLGFKVNNSFGQGYQAVQKAEYKDVVVQAAATLIKRYNPMIGSIRSWDHHADVWQFPVIIDNMMNLEMLFDATDFTGDSVYYDIAYQHAKTTLKNHFRPDNSSYHVIDYDTITGEVIARNTHQGASHESAWSRGQAWGLHGFTHCYRRTGDPAFLEQAKKIAKLIMEHPRLPDDHIPYWDFDAPEIPNEPRDVSAAAVAASALIDLSQIDTSRAKEYIEWVDVVLHALELLDYQSDVPPFLLDHSTGSVPGEFEVDVPISYGDYYYLEALLKRSELAN